MLVEDSLGDAVLIEEMLREDKSSRLEFAHFERLSDAREHLISEGADCVLLDLSLPDADGLNGLLQLLSGAADVPVVILTGTADEGLAMRALEEGAQDYLVKGRADRETVMRSVRYAIERKRAEGELAYQAFHDSLTGLPNRGLFLDRLGLALVRIARHSDLLAVMFLDLDDFKYVNDSLGHGAGDELLVKVADRLSTTIRPSDTVARFGGDEFVLLCEELTMREEATAIAERAQRALADPLFVAGQEIVASASIGIAITQDPRTSPDVLLRDADAAMYQAKGDGKARCVVFEAGRHPDDRKRLSLDSGLHHAVEREQLDLAWQPIWDLSEGRPIGAEGLLRWGHPQRGELAPDEFLHIAEERGQIVPIGYWVLSEACRQGREWSERLPGAAPLVCVNLSVRQLEDPHLVQRLAASLADTGFPPDRLCVEVTEQALLGTGADTDRTLLSLRDPRRPPRRR